MKVYRHGPAADIGGAEGEGEQVVDVVVGAGAAGVEQVQRGVVQADLVQETGVQGHRGGVFGARGHFPFKHSSATSSHF